MEMRFYRRDGRRVSKATVLAARDAYADAKAAGRMGHLRCSAQPEVAARVRRMTAVEFARWSGQFGYRPQRRR